MTTLRKPKTERLVFPLCLMVFLPSILAAGGAFAQGSAESAKPAPAPAKPASSSKAAAAKNAKAPAAGPSLVLNDFLTQVADKHMGYKAADLSAKGARLQASEGKLLTRPNLIGDATTSTLGRNDPLFAQDTFRFRAYSLGLQQQTDFGLKGALTYNRQEISIPAFNNLQFNADVVQIELSQSLWRNWAGAEVNSQAQAIEAGALARSFSQSFVNKQILLEAESYYWRLALAREMVKMQKEAVDRAERIAEWTGRRVRLQLADRAEGLQASTNLQARRLDLKQSEDEERAAAQAFNSSRGVDSNDVPEQLVVLDSSLVSRFEAPAKTFRRDDVAAAEFQSKAQQAQANSGQERNKPTVEVFARVPLNQPNLPTGPLATNLPINSLPATTVGVRFSAPLDLSTTSKAREGYAVESQAADLAFQRKSFEEARDWSDLTTKFTQAKDRLKLFLDLEAQQRDKLDYERGRQQRGRSTLQQVLIYENDLQVAQLGRIRTLAELLTLNAQMKLYGVSYESR